jgi:hypothetical protein
VDPFGLHHPLCELKKILVGEPEDKRPLRKPRYRWEDVIKSKHGEIVWIGFMWFRTEFSGVFL